MTSGNSISESLTYKKGYIIPAQHITLLINLINVCNNNERVGVAVPESGVLPKKRIYCSTFFTTVTQ